MQRIWQNYYEESDGIIFVVDGTDWERIDKVRDCFIRVTETEALYELPVLLLINKMDLQVDDEYIAKLKEKFNPILANIGAKECRVFTCSALKGYSIRLRTM